ncbi:hypothetical protein AAHC03_09432 [Spirometra sp. Aus1]|nr:unnamed protein product [Spirometra erinaceieuropaei]
MYYAEKSEASQFTSIPAAAWYTIVTMTTLGYGDIVPTTPIGKIFGGICSLSGVLVIALPVPVIVSNFARIYQQSQKADKHHAQQLSKAARLKVCESERYASFLEEKRQAATELKALLNGCNVRADDDSANRSEETDLSEGKIDSERRASIGAARMQHYHILLCLESLTGHKPAEGLIDELESPQSSKNRLPKWGGQRLTKADVQRPARCGHSTRTV